MKVIDLLNKIANGEEVPRKFTYKGYLWEYDVKNKTWFYYVGESKYHRFDRLFYINQILNDEVEIIEDEKIKRIQSCGDTHEKIKRIQSCGDTLYSEYIGEWLIHKENYTEYDELLMNKINEIIDKINKD